MPAQYMFYLRVDLSKEAKMKISRWLDRQEPQENTQCEYYNTYSYLENLNEKANIQYDFPSSKVLLRSINQGLSVYQLALLVYNQWTNTIEDFMKGLQPW